MQKYDLVVIGGGPAGYAAAMRALDFQKSVCIIEKSRIGGAGLYNGALSSKTLWEHSQKIRTTNANLSTFGHPPYLPTWDEIKSNLNEAIFERKFQYSCHVKLLQNETENCRFIHERGYASFLNEHEVEVDSGGKKKTIYGDHILIATGSSPRKLPNIDVDEEFIFTSDGIEDIKELPDSMVIIGAGVLGCEYATIYSNFGKTKVHIIDRQDRILPFEDEDISNLISRNFEDNGIIVHSEASLERLEKKDGRVEYELSYPDGKREVIQVDIALLSIGRVPNIDDLNIEKAGVAMSKRGIHLGDNDTLTNIPHIYAAGDVSGHIRLVNMGEIEARHAVEKMFDKKKAKLVYDNVCTIMFLQPEVAAVGLNEQQCVEKNIPIKVVKIDYSVIARAIAMRKTQGFFKIIVTNDDEMKILGMRAIGEHASSAIQAVGLLIKLNMSIEVLSELVHPHPSIVEGIQECVRMLLKKAVFKSSVFKDKLACYSLVDGVKTPLERL
jgi:dihydrolipoamide dehydrogenase